MNGGERRFALKNARRNSKQVEIDVEEDGDELDDDEEIDEEEESFKIDENSIDIDGNHV
jgi:hypothetical protein